MNLGNLDFAIGGINPSGIGATIYRIAKKDITAWPTINDDPNAATGTVASLSDLTAEALAFCKAAANGDFVFIVKAAGRFHVIGSPDYRAVISPSGDSGDAAGSAKGVTFEVECPDVTPLPLYEGTLTLADGSLDCSDGSFTPSNS